jgi:putative flippase GtrA
MRWNNRVKSRKYRRRLIATVPALEVFTLNLLERLSQAYASFHGGSAQFARFVLVGVVNTAFGYSIFLLVYAATGNHHIAIAVALTAGVIFSFHSNRRIVFAEAGYRFFAAFVVSYAVIYAVNIMSVDILIAAGLSANLSQLITLPAIVVISFLANAHLVFRKEDSHQKAERYPPAGLSSSAYSGFSTDENAVVPASPPPDRDS